MWTVCWCNIWKYDNVIEQTKNLKHDWIQQPPLFNNNKNTGYRYTSYISCILFKSRKKNIKIKTKEFGWEFVTMCVQRISFLFHILQNETYAPKLTSTLTLSFLFFVCIQIQTKSRTVKCKFFWKTFQYVVT